MKMEKCICLLIEKYIFVVFEVCWYVKINIKDVKI